MSEGAQAEIYFEIWAAAALLELRAEVEQFRDVLRQKKTSNAYVTIDDGAGLDKKKVQCSFPVTALVDLASAEIQRRESMIAKLGLTTKEAEYRAK